jgi:hypothetical protein
VGVEQEVDKQALDGDRIMPDLVVPARFRRRMLEPAQRAFAGQRRAVLASVFISGNGDRSYDDLGSWRHDLQRSWFGHEP